MFVNVCLYFRFSGPISQEAKGNDNIARVKSEVKNVVNIMQNNISKVLDRGAKIDDLHEKSGKYDFMFKMNLFLYN